MPVLELDDLHECLTCGDAVAIALIGDDLVADEHGNCPAIQL